MTTTRAEYPGWWAPWPAVPGFITGLLLADVLPLWGIAFGVLAVIGVTLGLVWHGPRWLVWLLGGVVLGVVALWALALVNTVNPGMASGSGSGSAAAVR